MKRLCEEQKEIEIAREMLNDGGHLLLLLLIHAGLVY
jgi:hypothetical protein